MKLLSSSCFLISLFLYLVSTFLLLQPSLSRHKSLSLSYFSANPFLTLSKSVYIKFLSFFNISLSLFYHSMSLSLSLSLLSFSVSLLSFYVSFTLSLSHHSLCLFYHSMSLLLSLSLLSFSVSLLHSISLIYLCTFFLCKVIFLYLCLPISISIFVFPSITRYDKKSRWKSK